MQAVAPQSLWSPYHIGLSGGLATNFFYNHPSIAQMAPVGFMNAAVSNRELCKCLRHTLPMGGGAVPPHVASIEPKVKNSYSIGVSKNS